MSAGGDNSSLPPSPKKARMSPSPSSSSWLPSCDQDSHSQPGEQESCASVDSGLSDSATPPHDSVTPPVLPPTEETLPREDEENRRDDDLSSLSGLSDMSGQEWKPNMTGKLAWLHRAMARGENPRGILEDMLPPGSEIPEGIDTMTLWKVLFNLLSEPPRRSKLSTVNTLEDCVELIKKCSNIVILTGAGVSVSCGIPDFRSKDGVYARLAQDFPDLPDPQAMFDIHYFRKDPRPFFKFAREIYPGQFKPSPCHQFIRTVETAGKLLRNYTQNIDTLEQVVGIRNVIQCHGSFATASCVVCKAQVSAEVVRDDIFAQKIPMCSLCPPQDIEALLSVMSHGPVPPSLSQPCADPTKIEQEQGASNEASSSSIVGPENPVPSTSSSDPCTSPNIPTAASSSLPNTSPFTTVPVMKPDIVFFGEGLPDHFHNSITRDKELCDLLIVIGSSLKVRPVALIPSSLPPEVPQILINREPLPHCKFDVELLGDCDSIINQICLMLGEDWTNPVHGPRLDQHLGLPPEYYKAKEASAKQEDGKEDDVQNKEKCIEELKSDAGEPCKPDISQSSCGKTKEDLNSDEISKEVDEESDDEFDHYSRPLSEYIPNGQYLFLPPARYVFTGAEVYPESSDDEGDNEEEEEEHDEPSSDLHIDPTGQPDEFETTEPDASSAALND